MSNEQDQAIQQKEDQVENLIAKLCVSAPTPQIKECLRLYEYGKSSIQIEKEFKTCNKQTLVGTMNYLKIPNENNYTKDIVAHHLLCRIQNLLPDTCSICQETYIFELNDTPLLECAICGQEVHRTCFINLLGAANIDIDKETFKDHYNPLKIDGIHYICRICSESTIPHPNAGLSKKKSSHSRVKKSTAPVTNIIENTYVNDLIDSDNTLSDQINTQKITEMSDDGQEDEFQTTNTQNENELLQKSSTMCRYFQKSSCRHGIKGENCKFSHPPLCKKYLQHGTRNPRGCNLGKACQHFHPQMCMSSLRKGECFNQTCKFRHVKGTKRIQNKYTPRANNTEQGNNLVTPNPTTTNQQPHFLEVIRLLKAEIMSSIDSKLAAVLSQMQPNQTTLLHSPKPPLIHHPQQYHIPNYQQVQHQQTPQPLPMIQQHLPFQVMTQPFAPMRIN